MEKMKNIKKQGQLAKDIQNPKMSRKIYLENKNKVFLHHNRI